MTQSLAEMAVEVLTTADGRAKTALGRAHAATWFAAMICWAASSDSSARA